MKGLGNRLIAIVAILLLSGMVVAVVVARPAPRDLVTGATGTPPPRAAETSGSDPTKAPDKAAATGEAPASPDCVGVVVTSDGPPQTVALKASHALVVFVGRVVAASDAHWDTEDGQRPSKVSGPGTNAFLYRTITFEVETAIRGTEAGEERVIEVPGGRLGCDWASTSGRLPDEIREGERYAVFLYAAESAPGVPKVSAMWPVREGVVETPADGLLDVERLQRMVELSPYEPLPTARPAGG